MLRCKLDQLEMVRLDEIPFVDAKIRERYDLQEIILKSPQPFFEEIGEPNLIIIGQEVLPSDVVADRIDILALDSEDGSLVAIELKRGKDKYQLLQAIHYAAMLQEWTQEDIIREYAKHKKLDQENLEEATQDLHEQEVELEALNRAQRCILVAEEYEPGVLITANWLVNKFGVRITCIRVRAVLDQLANQPRDQVCYLDVERIVPTLALEDFFVRRPRRAPGVAPISEGESTRRDAYLKFWIDVKKALLVAGHKWAENRTPSRDHWFNFSTGRSGIHVVASFAQGGRLRTEVGINTDDPAVNKQLFDELRKAEPKLASVIEGALSWERLDDKKASRLAVYRECDREMLDKDETYRSDCIKWIVERLGELRRVATEYVI